MNSIGMMQGRLTRRGNRSVQFFPFEDWKSEFETGAAIGLDELEYIFDFERYKENPLWTDNGIKKLRDAISKYGVRVNTICADYFMQRPFFRTSESDYLESLDVLKKLIRQSKAIGAFRIEIPLLDNSSIKTKEEESRIIDTIKSVLPLLAKEDIQINLETDLPPLRLKSLINACASPLIKITYDSGNSSSLGYDPTEEFSVYGEYVSNVHIKDRELNGSTVALGAGDTDFVAVFVGLRNSEYKGSFILQAARGNDGMEMETIRKQKDFVTDHTNRYLH